MSFINTPTFKRYMAFAGLIWFSYVIFHMLSLLNFHAGKTAFNDFYQAFDGSIIAILMIIVLFCTFIFHVTTAIARQLSNNISVGDNYQKAYPHGIPRLIAWGGAFTLLSFIVFHSVQMHFLVDKADWHRAMIELFKSPLMWLIYMLGLITLLTHLHHGLTNVLQTLGISSKQNQPAAIAIVLVLGLGFISIPVSILWQNI